MLSKKDFESYYSLYSDTIYNYIYFKVWNDASLAYDITSDVFMKVLKNLEKYDINKWNFQSWLYKIAGNTIIDYYRSNKEHEDIHDENIENMMFYYDDIKEKIDAQLDLERIYSELNKLLPETKKIITLRIFEELSFSEISKIMDMSEAACKMQVKRWLESIKDKLVMLVLLLLIF